MLEKFRHEDGPDPFTRVLIPCGDIDAATARDVRHRISAALAAGRYRVVVDLTEVTYMETSALASLVDADASARRRGGRVTIVLPVDSRVRLIFELTQADRLLKVLPSRDEALRAA